MATAEEKQARADANDAAAQAATTGKQRLATEVTKAARAFSGRRLRSAGDLSRYRIGGFLDDPNAPVAIPGQPRNTPGVTTPPGGAGAAPATSRSGSFTPQPAPVAGFRPAPTAPTNQLSTEFPSTTRDEALNMAATGMRPPGPAGSQLSTQFPSTTRDESIAQAKAGLRPDIGAATSAYTAAQAAKLKAAAQAKAKQTSAQVKAHNAREAAADKAKAAAAARKAAAIKAAAKAAAAAATKRAKVGTVSGHGK